MNTYSSFSKVIKLFNCDFFQHIKIKNNDISSGTKIISTKFNSTNEQIIIIIIIKINHLKFYGTVK